MRGWRQVYFLGLFVVTLVFCSVMIIRQIHVNQGRHIELREAFILLYNRGYRQQSYKLYQRLLQELPKLSDKALLDDFQRTLMLVDPASGATNNLIYNYHWTVSNELERRSAKALQWALKLADQLP